MKLRGKYRITVEDESHLRTVMDRRVPVGYLLAACAVGVLLLGMFVAMLAGWHPLGRTMTQTESEALRVASQTSALRLDSLSAVLARDRAWIENFQRVADTRREATDSARYASAVTAGDYNPDSLADASREERRFVSSLEERERFNISVLAPLDADGMTFALPASGATPTAASRAAKETELLMPADVPVQAIADGTVVAMFQRPGQGHTIVVQHGRGFVSSMSHTGAPLVSVGDAVNAGQPLAFAPAADARHVRRIFIRMWHNGTALVPMEMFGFP